MQRFMVVLFALIAASGLASAFSGEQQEIIGGGATFPFPLYSKMCDRERSARPAPLGLTSGSATNCALFLSGKPRASRPGSFTFTVRAVARLVRESLRGSSGG